MVMWEQINIAFVFYVMNVWKASGDIEKRQRMARRMARRLTNDELRMANGAANIE